MATSSVSNDNAVVILNKEVMDNLVCSQCKKLPSNATVSWCSAHHLMCQSCYDHHRPCIQISKKVQCGAACHVESKPALSPFLASVLKKLTTKCKFTHNGCQVSIIPKVYIHMCIGVGYREGDFLAWVTDRT
jgi:hypothetical protein